MWGDTFSQEAASIFEKYSLSNDDENEDLAQTFQLANNYESSNGKAVFWTDMEYTHFDDEEDELAQTFEESTQLSRKSRGNDTKSRITFFICDVCEEQVMSSKCYRSYWRQTFCKEHDTDGSPKCCSCLRFKIGNVEYLNLNDGRKLCPDCYSTSVLDTEGCKSLASQVYTFYRGLNMDIRKDFPILLVDQIEMSTLFKNPVPKRSTIVGMTTFTVETINCVNRSSRVQNDIEVVKQVRHLDRNSPVTSVLLLYGLPKLATGATLAHEMMHAWMRLEGYHSLDLKIEEGLCEVMGHKWIEWYSFIGEKDNRDDEEAQFLINYKAYVKNTIEERYNKTYGDGFREAKWAVERYGLQYTLKTIANTGKFPD